MLNDLQKNLCCLKFLGLTNKLKKCFNNSEEEMLNWLNEISIDFNKIDKLNNLKYKMDAFKEEIGEEYFIILINSPNFNEVIEKWEEKKRYNSLVKLTDIIQNKLAEFNDYISPEEFKEAFLGAHYL